jgi:hypothetical protein
LRSGIGAVSEADGPNGRLERDHHWITAALDYGDSAFNYNVIGRNGDFPAVSDLLIDARNLCCGGLSGSKPPVISKPACVQTRTTARPKMAVGKRHTSMILATLISKGPPTCGLVFRCKRSQIPAVIHM